MTARAIQLALDVLDAPTALRVAHAAANSVQIIEAGTVLCLSQGMVAVRALRIAFPDKPLVADIRASRAGGKFAKIAFDAGADRITVVGECPTDVLTDAVRAAQVAGGAVEVELPPVWTVDDVRRWEDAGVATLIVHRNATTPASEDDATRSILDRLAALPLAAATVTLAGGIGPGDLKHFGQNWFDVVAIGSSISAADDPASAAAAFAAELVEIGSSDAAI